MKDELISIAFNYSQIFHTSDDQSDYVHACLVTVFQIHRNEPPGLVVLVEIIPLNLLF